MRRSSHCDGGPEDRRPSHSLMLSWKTLPLDPIESQFTYVEHTRRMSRTRRSIDNTTPRTMRHPPPFVQKQQIDAAHRRPASAKKPKKKPYTFDQRQRKVYEDFTSMLADNFDLYVMKHILDDALRDARRKTMLGDYSTEKKKIGEAPKRRPLSAAPLGRTTSPTSSKKKGHQTRKQQLGTSF